MSCWGTSVLTWAMTAWPGVAWLGTMCSPLHTWKIRYSQLWAVTDKRKWSGSMFSSNFSPSVQLSVCCLQFSGFYTPQTLSFGPTVRLLQYNDYFHWADRLLRTGCRLSSMSFLCAMKSETVVFLTLWIHDYSITSWIFIRNCSSSQTLKNM